MNSKSIKTNTVYNIIRSFLSIIFPVITFPYISRVLLAENVGKINFSLSIVSYFSLIASLGISTYAIRECSAVRDNQSHLNDLSSQIFSINLFTTALAYILLILTLVFWRNLENYRTLIIVQSLSIIFTTLGTDWLNSAMEDFRYITIRTAVFQVVSLVLMFSFVHQPSDYMKYAAISLISSSGANIINIWYRSKYCKIKFTKNINWKKHMIPISLLFAMILAQNIFANMDSTMIGLMRGDREVGIYGVAHKVNSIVSQMVSSALWVIMPRMSYYFSEKNYVEINKLLRKLLGFNLLFGLPCATGIIILAKDIVLIIAGQDFVEAAPVLRIRTISFIFALLGGNLLGNAVLLPSKKEKYYMFICLITAGINVFTNYIFIPKHGAIAAAGTTAFCSLCILIMTALCIDKNIKFQNVSKLILTPIIGCIGIVIICFLFSCISNLIIRVSVSILCSTFIYVLLQIILKNSLTSECLNIAMEKLKRRK